MATVAVPFIHQFCNTFIASFDLFAIKFVLQFVLVKEAMLPVTNHLFAFHEP